MAIAQIQALLRKLARRTFEDLVDAIGRAMTSISSHDALKFHSQLRLPLGAA
jgi:hypothetical protein